MSFKKKTIYNVANLFDVYKNQLDAELEDDFFLGIHECTNFSSPYLDNGVSDNICQRSIKYFSHLKEQVNSDYIDQGCRYFCYWLHDKILKNQKPVDNTINLYKQLLQKYKDYEEAYVFQEYIEHFNNDMLANLIKLIELYGKFNIIKKKITSCDNCDCVQASADLYNHYVDECYTCNDNDFCDELENFKHTYENHMNTENCPEVVPKILPPIKRYNLAPIVSIPFVLTLVVSFVFFILYKFTTVGLRIRSILKTKKSIYNDIDQETNELMYISGKYNVNSKNNEYSLSYQSV
ncbi:PIR Superfamily Protein [Plasmodium ovale wallikeri]|uniref:PIR Superfamily Protein n=1 Tax=Plasmodium ovale wallikeri TaxID=864142 RepID=A0A1A9ALV0_PLAOA|nr:PIR Superfamily Protein [Plasmodium ovale wallikeri]SBT57731.1 PIR Superfamily Protein [Plasmodium ovale wallikeri]